MIAVANITGGRYDIDSLPAGFYEVRIQGSSHLEHRSLRYEVSRPVSDFTVIQRDACRFGVCFRDRFPKFFDTIARGKQHNRNSVRRWMTPPTEIYVTREMLSSERHANFMRLVRQVAHELFHAAFAGHAYGTGDGKGLMNGNNHVTRLSSEDRLAACLVYHPDTHVGNTAPDTNP